MITGETGKNNEHEIGKKYQSKEINCFADVNEMKISSEDEDDFFDKKEAKDCSQIKVRNHEVRTKFNL